MTKSVVLLSGGLASRLLLKTLADPSVLFVFVDFGQASASVEKALVEKACKDAGARLYMLDVPELGRLMSGPVVSGSLSCPDAPWESPRNDNTLPRTMFRTLVICGTSVALFENAEELVIGLTADMMGMSPELDEDTLSSVVMSMSDGAVRLAFPQATDEIDEVVRALESAAGRTVSCLKAPGTHCGVCAKCRARREAFKSAEVFDPTPYASMPSSYDGSKSPGQPDGPEITEPTESQDGSDIDADASKSPSQPYDPEEPEESTDVPVEP